MAKKEAKFQTYFKHWAEIYYPFTAAFELKQTERYHVLFDSVKPHQEQALSRAKHGHFIYKIVDAGYQNPFDCFSLKEVLSFVVVKFPEFFCLIDIDSWIQEKKTSNRKSLTHIRAKEISTLIVEKSS